jgi:phosphate uptake regulator
MSFFEDLGKTVNYAMSETASRTKELAGVVKLNTSICARQHEIEKAYTAIGRAVFEREAADPESPVAALCAKVLANQEAIASMKQQIADLKNEANEERKARSEAIFGSKENPVEQAVEEVTEEVAEMVEEAAEAVAEAAEEKAE